MDVDLELRIKNLLGKLEKLVDTVQPILDDQIKAIREFQKV